MCALVAATLTTGPEVAAMKVRRLDRTGLKVSVIGVGTWQLGGEWGGASPNRLHRRRVVGGHQAVAGHRY